MSPAEAQQQPRGPHGSLEREPLEDRGLRLARVRRRVRRHRRRRSAPKYLEQNDLAVGEAATPPTRSSRPASRTAADEQGEIVLIQSKTLKARRSGLQGRDRGRRRRRSSGFPAGAEARLAARRRSRRPGLGRPPLGDGQFSPQGTYDEAVALHRQDRRPPVDKTAAAPPGLRDRASSAASAPTKAVDAAFNSMLAKAGMIAIPLTLVILLLVFGSAVAAADPAAAGDHGGHRDHRA